MYIMPGRTMGLLQRSLVVAQKRRGGNEEEETENEEKRLKVENSDLEYWKTSPKKCCL